MVRLLEEPAPLETWAEHHRFQPSHGSDCHSIRRDGGNFLRRVFTALIITGNGPHPEIFTIIQASSLSSTGTFDPNTVQPTGSPPSFSSINNVCTSTSPINNPVTGGVLVPPGQSCTITATVTGGVQVNYGASLTVQGTTISGDIKDNRSSTISLQSASVSGNMYLYGTETLMMTGSHQFGGNVQLNGVKYASISSSSIGGNFQATSSGSVQVDSNTISGTVLFSNDKIVRLTTNTINGTLTFTSDPDCLSQGNTVSGSTTGTCTGGTISGGLDIMNSGASTVSFNGAYLNSQPWTGVSWQLTSGTTEQCGNAVIPVGACITYPIVIPPRQTAHVSFTWTPPDSITPVRIAMWTLYNNYLEARVDPVAGLTCSTSGMVAPREPVGYC